MTTDFRDRARTWFAEESVGTDLGRAFRATVGVMVPIALSIAGYPRGGGAPLMAVAAIAAQGIAMLQVRGAYALRVVVMLAMGGVILGAVALGAWASGRTGPAGLWVAVAATALVAINNGVWRHLSSEFGPAVAASVGLLFFIELTRANGQVWPHVCATLVGLAWGLLIQMGAWPVQPEHPLRRAVAESLLATGDLLAALGKPANDESDEDRAARLAGAESDWREALDHTYAILDAAATRRGRAKEVVKRLAALNLAAAHTGTLARALVTATEGAPLAPRTRAAWESATDGVRDALRGVAVAAVSHQPAHVGAAEVRLRRARGLLAALRESVGPDSRPAAVAGRFEDHLGETARLLTAAVGAKSSRAAYPVELLDADAWRLRAAAAGVNLSPRIDPAIVKFTARLGLLLVLATLVIKTADLPHGYWLPFTMIVVLQPDYGSTRKKAAQRLGGTVLGSILATGVLMLHLPHPVVMLAATAMSFVFVFFLRRNYGVAVVFITLYVVLLFEARQPVTIALAVERVAATLTGGVLALAAAVVFWPEWERQRVAANVARALRANAEYLRLTADRLREGAGSDDALLRAKRAAETANRNATASVRRLSADPESRRAGTEWAAVLANAGSRVTRALNGVFLHLGELRLPAPAAVSATAAANVMTAVADVVETSPGAMETLHKARTALDRYTVTPDTQGTARWVTEELARVGAEVGAIGTVAGLTAGVA